MSNDSILASFFWGQSNAYAGQAGEAEGRLKVVRERLETAKANEEGLVALRNALVKALSEVAPNHPLADKENRNKIFNKAYDAASRK